MPALPGAASEPGVVHDIPARADGVQLIGEMQGSGYRETPALVRRSDGQTLQLTPLLYLVLDAVDGRRTHEEIATNVSAGFGRLVTADNVRELIESQLRPLGLLTREDGSQPELKKSNPLLGLRFRYAVTDPAKTARLTAPFARLFHPLLVLAVVTAFLLVCWWVLFEKGLASATHDAFDKPGLLILILAVTVFSAGFHEFGHAAAASRGGSTPGVMGMGVYLVWPAFYTDVTDSYRLGRGGRLRTDLGGLYFNAIIAVAVVGVWWVSGYDALLLVVATQILQMLRQLAPLVRFDGYHVLADLTGVPDLFARIKPTLLGLLPWNWRSPEARVLKPWARAVVTLWVLVVIPVLLFALLTMVVALPRVVGTAWASLKAQRVMLGTAWDQGDLLSATARVLSMVVVGFSILAIVFILVRLGRQVGGSVWRRTSGKPVQRGIAMVAAAAVVTGLAWVWWPNPGTYRPIQAYERGTLIDAVPLARPAPTGYLVEGTTGQMQAVWPPGSPPPTQDQPQLAMVLVPRAAQPVVGDPAEGSDDVQTVGDTSTDPAQAPSWVFPFDRPLAPEAGDNQAMAVNTEDGSVVYDVAFALVWAEDETVDNTNEAYALASCKDCAAVAVGFQVVLVVGQADVVVPQNLSAAVNYNCVRCLTYALANQLVVTLDGPLSDAGMAELAALWETIAEFGENIENVPLGDLRDALSEFETQILAIIEQDAGVGPSGGQTSDEASAAGEDSSDADPAQADDDTSAGPDSGASDASTPASSSSPSGSEPSSNSSAGSSSGSDSRPGGAAGDGSNPSASPTSPEPESEPSPSAATGSSAPPADAAAE